MFAGTANFSVLLNLVVDVFFTTLYGAVESAGGLKDVSGKRLEPS